VVLGEPITPPKIAGAVAILAGVALTRLELQGAAAADTPSEA
jgi:drug/metabolite transporter (DMT)-like permease